MFIKLKKSQICHRWATHTLELLLGPFTRSSCPCGTCFPSPTPQPTHGPYLLRSPRAPPHSLLCGLLARLRRQLKKLQPEAIPRRAPRQGTEGAFHGGDASARRPREWSASTVSLLAPLLEGDVVERESTYTSW